MIPAAQAGAALGEELKTLTADDGARLSQILWQLRGETRRAPEDLNAATALVFALSLAGQVQDARAEARRCEEMRRAQAPEVPVHLHLNVLFGLTNTGLLPEAIGCLTDLDKSVLGPHLQRFLRAVVSFTLRFGLRFPEGPWGLPPAIQFLQERRLYERWQAQQLAVERLLGEHVTMIEPALDRLDDNETCDRLVLTYHTGLTSYSEIDALDAQLWRTLEDVYAEQPGGAGVLIGNVIFELRGPSIPLEDMTP